MFVGAGTSKARDTCSAWRHQINHRARSGHLGCCARATAAACPSSPRSRRPTSCARSWVISAFRPNRPHLCRPVPLPRSRISSPPLPPDGPSPPSPRGPGPGVPASPAHERLRGDPRSPRSKILLTAALSASYVSSGEGRGSGKKAAAGRGHRRISRIRSTSGLCRDYARKAVAGGAM